MADKKKKVYIVLNATDLSFLEDQVNQRIAEGYVPHGNFTVYEEPGVSGVVFFQPMVLKKAPAKS